MGRALTPLVGTVDIKFFCEQRPGLMAWLAINAGCAVHAYQLTGGVSMPMLLVNVFHYLYVLDTFVFEVRRAPHAGGGGGRRRRPLGPNIGNGGALHARIATGRGAWCVQRAVLSTADITTEGFGYMLCFGDLVWVPFTYSLQARFLSYFDVVLSPAKVASIVMLFVLGFVTFRLSNLEKDRFRRNPDAPENAALKAHSILTHTGSRLLASGWWGMARHINYLGDWLLSLAGCLACGPNAIPYFFVLYFGILLIHRERRDDYKCSNKYGPAWAEYTRRVPWRIIPYVY